MEADAWFTMIGRVHTGVQVDQRSQFEFLSRNTSDYFVQTFAMYLRGPDKQWASSAVWAPNG